MILHRGMRWRHHSLLIAAVSRQQYHTRPTCSDSVTATSQPLTIPASSALNFDDVSTSFANKTSWELLRALVVFKLCSMAPIVSRAKPLYQTAHRIAPRITTFIMRHTFFAHFCAGETGDDIQPIVQKLAAAGIGSILDYAAEADITDNTASDGKQEQTVDVAYAGEAQCDANAAICLSAIQTAARSKDGFAALKVTALGKPELLERMSAVLLTTRRMFRAFTEHAALDERSTPQISMSKRIDFATFVDGLRALKIDLNDEQMKRLFDRMDKSHDATIDYLEWIDFLDPSIIGGMNPRFRSKGLPTLSDEELSQMKAMIKRLESLAAAAAEHHVKLLIDAEQSYFQSAIDHLVLYLQRKFNRKTPIIFHTYQCYLTDAYSRVLLDMERAKREGFWLAAKCVRGAYLVSERDRAGKLAVEDPIQPDLDKTHASYHLVATTFLESIDRTSVMIATHNESTVKYVTKRMAELNIQPSGAGVYFGQLLGMCDHVTYELGRLGYQVYKYVPYGAVNEVMPYLIRRAEENSSVMSGAHKERRLIAGELLRRIGLR